MTGKADLVRDCRANAKYIEHDSPDPLADSYAMLLERCADRIEELEARLRYSLLHRTRPSLVIRHPGALVHCTMWIPVSERLPEPGEAECYRVWIPNEVYGDDVVWDFDDSNGVWAEVGVTHWMPLPPPLKELGEK